MPSLRTVMVLGGNWLGDGIVAYAISETIKNANEPSELRSQIMLLVWPLVLILGTIMFVAWTRRRSPATPTSSSGGATPPDRSGGQHAETGGMNFHSEGPMTVILVTSGGSREEITGERISAQGREGFLGPPETIERFFAASAVIVRPMTIQAHATTYDPVIDAVSGTESITVRKIHDPVVGAPTRVDVDLQGRINRVLDVGCRPTAVRVGGSILRANDLPHNVHLQDGIVTIKAFVENGLLIDEPTSTERLEIEVYCATGAES